MHDSQYLNEDCKIICPKRMEIPNVCYLSSSSYCIPNSCLPTLGLQNHYVENFLFSLFFFLFSFSFLGLTKQEKPRAESGVNEGKDLKQVCNNMLSNSIREARLTCSHCCTCLGFAMVCMIMPYCCHALLHHFSNVYTFEESNNYKEYRLPKNAIILEI